MGSTSVRQTIFDNLVTAIEDVANDSTYPLAIRTVRAIDFQVANLTSVSFPIILVNDPGPVQTLVQDSTHERKRLRIYLVGVVQAKDAAELGRELCKMVSFLEQFIDSNASLGANWLQTKMVQVRTNEYEVDGSLRANTLCEVDVRYWVERGNY